MLNSVSFQKFPDRGKAASEVLTVGLYGLIETHNVHGKSRFHTQDATIGILHNITPN
jgi:hypothetical protein